MKTAAKNDKIRLLYQTKLALDVRSGNFYRLRRGKLRCKNCLYEFKPKLGGLKLTRGQWRRFITWFVLDYSLRIIKEQTRLSHYSVSLENMLGGIIDK